MTDCKCLFIDALIYHLNGLHEAIDKADFDLMLDEGFGFWNEYFDFDTRIFCEVIMTLVLTIRSKHKRFLHKKYA